MQSETPTTPPHDGGDPLSRVLREVLAADAEIAAAETRRVRALAEAGHLALDVLAGSRASSRAAEMALREVASEIAAAERLSDRTVQAQIGRAMAIADDYPATLDAWQAGQLSRAHAQVVVEAGLPVPPERRAEFETMALEVAVEASPGRLKTRLAALAERLQPTTLTERHRAGRALRGVRVVRGENGMSDLIATLPSVIAEGIYDRLMRQSRVLIDARDSPVPDAIPPASESTTPSKGASAGAGPAASGFVSTSQGASQGSSAIGDVAAAAGAAGAAGRSGGIDPGGGGFGSSRGGTSPDAGPGADIRTADQIRADILSDLLLTAVPAIDPTRSDDGPGALGAIRAKVQVIVPALTMLDPANEGLDPAELVGHGPIDTETARALAEATPVPWDRVVTHPISGAVLHVDTYQRTAAIDRYLRARDRHCRWPGCTAPAIRSEVDHNRDYALGGSTDVANLCHLCQRHHSQKQFTRWKVRQLPGGVMEFTSPTGRVYVDEPLPYASAVQFRPDDPPSPSPSQP